MMERYWGRPDLNDRAFYTREVIEGYEQRFYRTGDLVQYLPDGNLRFLGRKDRQIKVRGYRVELDQIEAALVLHDAVLEAAVYSIADEQGSRSIYATVILDHDKPGIESDSLTRYLAGCLPWHVVPGKVEILDAFPRTTSGKIDRHKLELSAMPSRTN